MSIQGQFNQALGAAAAAAYTIGTEKEKAAEQYSLAESQKADASADVKEIKTQQEKVANDIKGYEAEVKNFTDTANMEEGSMEQLNEYFRQKQVMSEKEAAQKAFSILQDKMEAKQAVISRAEKIMKRTSKWGGMR